MKLIFLDIDGVMNSQSGHGPYIADMEVDKLKLLKKLIDESESSGIVLISDRRFSKPYMDQFIKALAEFEILLVGQLRRPKDYKEDPLDNRGKQISDYLENSKDIIDKIVILDDNDEGLSELFHEDFVLVNKYYGLNIDIYNKALEILK